MVDFAKFKKQKPVPAKTAEKRARKPATAKITEVPPVKSEVIENIPIADSSLRAEFEAFRNEMRVEVLALTATSSKFPWDDLDSLLDQFYNRAQFNPALNPNKKARKRGLSNNPGAWTLIQRLKAARDAMKGGT